MIGLSNTVKDAMLAVIVDRASTVGLFVGEEEIVDDLYERQPIEFSDPLDDGDVRMIENVNDVRFADMDRDRTVDHWGVFDERGELMTVNRLNDRRDDNLVPAEDNARFKPGKLSIGMP